MSKFMTNSCVMGLFKERDALKERAASDTQAQKRVDAINDEIVNGIGFLVYNNAKLYRKFPNYEDLVQEGFVGLIKATKRFNHTLFPNFFVYSDQWVRHSIKRAASRFDVVYNPNKTRVIYAEPEEAEKEETAETPEDVMFAKEASDKIEKVLGELPHRDCDIVKRIFGLGDYAPQTLREIGPIYGLTYERVRQIKNKVIARLRKNECLGELY